MNKMQTQELISALADGQLSGEAFVRGVEAACGPEGLQAWRTYHLIGDVLRSGECGVGMVPEDFLTRLQSRLQREQRPSPTLDPTGRPARLPAERPAANDSSFRWKVLAGFASLTAVAAIGWTMTGELTGKSPEPQLAEVSSERGVMIRDPRLDEFLAAHRQLGGASAVQMPSGFLRSATFEGPVR